jgi:hypothetical protein
MSIAWCVHPHRYQEGRGDEMYHSRICKVCSLIDCWTVLGYGD